MEQKQMEQKQMEQEHMEQHMEQDKQIGTQNSRLEWLSMELEHRKQMVCYKRAVMNKQLERQSKQLEVPHLQLELL